MSDEVKVLYVGRIDGETARYSERSDPLERLLGSMASQHPGHEYDVDAVHYIEGAMTFERLPNKSVRKPGKSFMERMK